MNQDKLVESLLNVDLDMLMDDLTTIQITEYP